MNSACDISPDIRLHIFKIINLIKKKIYVQTLTIGTLDTSSPDPTFYR